MRLSQFSLTAKPETFRALSQRLTEIGYEEAAVTKAIGRWDISEMQGQEYPSYIWRCKQDDSKLSQAISFFLMSGSLSPEALNELIGESVVEDLCKSYLILKYQGTLIFALVLYPCLGQFIFTDQWVSTGSQAPGKIYELGTDSYVLARVTPRQNVKRALDLCTGSGVHAIFSALSGAETQAVDINPRAKLFTELNAQMNGVTCQTHLGDLYEPVSGQTFDLITANPPFVPSPDPKVLVHRSTGENGEEVPRRLVSGLPEHLEKGGLFSMVLDYPKYEDDTYLDRLESWIGQDRGWGIAVLDFNEKTVANYVITHTSGVPNEEYNQVFEQYLESYKRMGIEAMCFAHVFILRLEEDIPNWKVSQATPWPNINFAPQMSNWLECLVKYHSEIWEPDPQWKPKLSENYKSVWRDWDKERGALELAPDNWLNPDFLDADETEFLFRIKNGTETIESLKVTWRQDGRSDESFEKTLRELILKRTLA